MHCPKGLVGSNPTSGIKMCGRYTLTDPDPRRLTMRFDLPEGAPLPDRPRFNIAPTTEVLAVREVIGEAGPSGKREAGLLRWGLIPAFARPEDFDRLLINARSETVASKPIFSEAFRNGRCLVVADGFYEWKKTDVGKKPFFFSLPGRELFAFAGISAAATRADGEEIHSCALLTCEPSEVVAEVHKRMPVILEPADESVWLDPETPEDALLELFRPLSGLEAREVSESVNSSRNEGPELLDGPMNLF